MRHKLRYIDKSGQTVMRADQYYGAGPFSEGLASINVEHQGWGFIDKTGKVVIRPQFQQAGGFSEGLATVKIKNKWGFIDKSGQIVIQPQYDEVNDMSEGVAVVSIGKSIYFINRNGEKIFSRSMDELQLDIYGNTQFSEGLIFAFDCKKSKYGFVEKTGKFIIEPNFDDAANFSEGLARVMVVKDGEEKVGFIDHNGQFIIQPIFNADADFRRNSTDFSEGLASLTENLRPTITEPERYVYLNKKGEIVLSTKFFYAGSFHDGMAIVYDSDKDKWGYIDKLGRLAIQPQYDFVGEFSEGLACVGVIQ